MTLRLLFYEEVLAQSHNAHAQNELNEFPSNKKVGTNNISNNKEAKIWDILNSGIDLSCTSAPMENYVIAIHN